MDQQTILDGTRHWIASVVIGLNLCPFAQGVFLAERIRYTVTDAEDEATLLEALAAELKALAAPVGGVETTLLIHPFALRDFLDFNDFLGDAERLVEKLGLRGTIQLASFHPDYQFAGTRQEALENYTNRSPYPMLHLLREESVTAAVSNLAQARAIPLRNAETLRRLGRDKILERLQGIKRTQG